MFSSVLPSEGRERERERDGEVFLCVCVREREDTRQDIETKSRLQLVLKPYATNLSLIGAPLDNR